MIRPFSLFFILFWGLSTCSPSMTTTNTSPKKYCEPGDGFLPSLATVTLAGQVIFESKNKEYYFDLPSSNWQCEKLQSPTVNKFKSTNAQDLKRSLRKKDISREDILIARTEMSSRENFQAFVSSKCASEGLPYLFEVSAPRDQQIYGCQINPQITSALMWKRTNNSQDIELAYLPFYQPFVDRILKN